MISCIVLNQDAEGMTLKGKAAGLIIEKPLLISGKLHYTDIINYDNSIAKYSGGFVKTQTDVKRLPTKYKNSYEFYQNVKNFTVFVNPPIGYEGRLPMIEILANLNEFHTQEQMVVIENKTVPLKDFKADQTKRTFSKDRYVTPNCMYAKINVRNWQVILPDTITFMKHLCDPKFTKIDVIENQYKNVTQHDIATSGKYKLDKFYADVKTCAKIKDGCAEVKNRQVITSNDKR